MNPKVFRIVLCSLLVVLLLSMPVSAQTAEEASDFYSLTWEADSENILLFSRDEVEKDGADGSKTSLVTLEPQDGLRFADYCQSENVILSVEPPDKVMVFALDDGKMLSSFQIDMQMNGLSCSPVDGKFFVSSVNDMAVSAYETKGGSFIKTLDGFQTAAPVYSAMSSPNGESILWHARNSFQLQDFATEELYAHIQVWDFADVYGLSPDGSVLAVALMSEDYFEAVLVFFDTKSGEELHRISLGTEQPRSLAFDPQGDVIIVADNTNFYAFSMTTFEMLEIIQSDLVEKSLFSEDMQIRDISFSPDGDSLAVLTNDGKVERLALN